MAKARVTRKFNSAQTSRPELAARYIFFVKQANTARRSLRLGHPCVFNVTFGSPNVRCAFGSHPCSVDYCSAVKRTPQYWCVGAFDKFRLFCDVDHRPKIRDRRRL